MTLLLCNLAGTALCFTSLPMRNAPSWAAITHSLSPNLLMVGKNVDDVTSFPSGRLPQPQLNSPAEIESMTNTGEWEYSGTSKVEGTIPEPWFDACRTSNLVTKDRLQAAYSGAIPWAAAENTLVAATDAAKKDGSDKAMEALSNALLAASQFPQCEEALGKAEKQLATMNAKKVKDTETAAAKEAEAAAPPKEAEEETVAQEAA